MALDTTIGGASANSYASIATADAYHLAHGNAGWTGSDSLKEAALIRATDWLDGRYRARWPGKPVYLRDQALCWPRAWATDVDGNPILSTVIPPEVVRAVCEAAVREIVTPFCLTPDVTIGREKVLTELKGIKWDMRATSATTATLRPVLTAVDDLLSNIIGATGSGIVMRG